MTIEEAAKHYASVTDPEAHGIDFIREVFIAGAEWQKEQMMEKAIEGIVERAPSGKAISVKHEGGGDYWAFGNEVAKQFNLGDKVRIVVCKKED